MDGSTEADEVSPTHDRNRAAVLIPVHGDQHRRAFPVPQLLDDVPWDRDAGVVPTRTQGCLEGHAFALFPGHRSPVAVGPIGTSPWPTCSPRRVHRRRYRPGTTARLIVAE